MLMPQKSCPEAAGQEAVIARAVEKLVAAGAFVGLGPADLIQLLSEGMTVGQLCDFLAAKLEDRAVEN